jgi:hypothetical protein
MILKDVRQMSKGTFGEYISVNNTRYHCTGCTDFCALITGQGTKPPSVCVKGDVKAKWKSEGS